MIRLPDKEVFRADEVMMLFGFKTVKTVYRWIRTGRLKYIVTPGGWKRITRSETLRIAQEVQADPDMLKE
jgi:predicted site-specific integrase-resolvase